MRILGIDPGTLVTGFGCIEVTASAGAPAQRGVDRPASGAPIAHRVANLVRRRQAQGRVRFVDAGALQLGGRQASLADRLRRLADELRRTILALAPAELALEQAFVHRSIAAALRIGEARGVVLAEARRLGLSIHEYPPARVKLAVGGRGNAGKDALARLVAQQLGLATAPTPRDASDALAVALCRAVERSSPAACLPAAGPV